MNRIEAQRPFADPGEPCSRAAANADRVGREAHRPTRTNATDGREPIPPGNTIHAQAVVASARP